jgi:hypothetical protein
MTRETQKALLIGGGVVALAGVGWFIYSRTSSGSGSGPLYRTPVLPPSSFVTSRLDASGLEIVPSKRGGLNVLRRVQEV